MYWTPKNREVCVLDYGGALLTTLGEPGEGPGEFRGRTEKAAVADQGSVADLEKMEALLAALSA